MSWRCLWRLPVSTPFVAHGGDWLATYESSLTLRSTADGGAVRTFQLAAEVEGVAAMAAISKERLAVVTYWDRGHAEDDRHIKSDIYDVQTGAFERNDWQQFEADRVAATIAADETAKRRRLTIASSMCEWMLGDRMRVHVRDANPVAVAFVTEEGGALWERRSDRTACLLAPPVRDVALHPTANQLVITRDNGIELLAFDSAGNTDEPE